MCSFAANIHWSFELEIFHRKFVFIIFLLPFDVFCTLLTLPCEHFSNIPLLRNQPKRKQSNPEDIWQLDSWSSVCNRPVLLVPLAHDHRQQSEFGSIHLLPSKTFPEISKKFHFWRRLSCLFLKTEDGITRSVVLVFLLKIHQHMDQPVE